jgi:hypothetical protein
MAVSQLMRVGLVSIIGDRTCDRVTGVWAEILEKLGKSAIALFIWVNLQLIKNSIAFTLILSYDPLTNAQLELSASLPPSFPPTLQRVAFGWHILPLNSN